MTEKNEVEVYEEKEGRSRSLAERLVDILDKPKRGSFREELGDLLSAADMCLTILGGVKNEDGSFMYYINLEDEVTEIENIEEEGSKSKGARGHKDQEGIDLTPIVDQEGIDLTPIVKPLYDDSLLPKITRSRWGDQGIKISVSGGDEWENEGKEGVTQAMAEAKEFQYSVGVRKAHKVIKSLMFLIGQQEPPILPPHAPLSDIGTLLSSQEAARQSIKLNDLAESIGDRKFKLELVKRGLEDPSILKELPYRSEDPEDPEEEGEGDPDLEEVLDSEDDRPEDKVPEEPPNV